MDYKQLKLNPNNPRIIKDDKYKKLKQSLKDFPQMLELRPIVYDDTNTILGGNMRLRALQELASEGMEIKDEWFKKASELTEEQKKEFIIKDNVPFGEWDYDILANEWSDLPLDGWGLDIDGWDDKEIIEDEAPELSDEEPKSKLGEVYQLGRHRLMCGDSTKIEDVEKLMNGQKVDISFTSPPYNVGHNLGYKGKSSKYELSNDNIEDYRKLLNETTKLSISYATDVFVNLQFLANNKKDLVMYMADMSDWFKDIFFWKKRQVQPAAAMNVANSQTEVIFNFSSDNSDEKYWVEIVGLYGMNSTRRWGNKPFRGTFSNIIETKSASTENENAKIHNATMPVALPATFLNKGYKIGSKVMDLFAGTGTTMVASEQLGMSCYMMELDPKYCDVIRKRYAKFMGKEDEWEQIAMKTN